MRKGRPVPSTSVSSTRTEGLEPEPIQHLRLWFSNNAEIRLLNSFFCRGRVKVQFNSTLVKNDYTGGYLLHDRQNVRGEQYRSAIARELAEQHLNDRRRCGINTFKRLIK